MNTRSVFCDKSQWQGRLQTEKDRILASASATLAGLSQNQKTAEVSANQRIESIRKRSSEKAALLIQRQREIAEAYAARHCELDGDIREGTKEVYQQNWHLAKANRELSKYNSVSFQTMVKRVFFLN